MKASLCMLVFCIAVFSLAFSGYSLDDLHFNVLFIFAKESLPDFWGLHALAPVTNQIDFSFLYRNEGLMAMMFALLHRLPLSVEEKILFHNTLNLGLQLLNVGLFAYVMRKLVGSSSLFPYLFFYLLYPFAASNHYWQANLNMTFVATLFLISLALFLNVTYETGKIWRNLLFWIIPSLIFLWLSIIMTEYAVVLSPIYVYLALYYSNRKAAIFKFDRLLTPYTVAASLLLVTSVAPLLLFSGHRLTVASYMTRYETLSGDVYLPVSLIAFAITVVNGILVFVSFLFANTVGLLVYPVAGLVAHTGYLTTLPVGIAIGIVLVAVLGGFVIWLYSIQSTPLRHETDRADDRFLMVLGGLWVFLAYFPFMLSIGYPRNVGLLVDRINVLGSMGIALCTGTLFCRLQKRVSLSYPHGMTTYAVATALLAVVLLLNLQIQKAHYIEAEQKERGLVEAVLNENIRMLAEGRRPIFLIEKTAEIVFPFTQLRRALNEPTVWGKVAKVGHFLFQRHFVDVNASTSLNFSEIYFFWCCPSSAPVTFNFFADWTEQPRPIVYKREEPFRLTEDQERYMIGYANTEIWKDPSYQGEFQSYPKKTHELVVLEIGESTFKLGGPLAYSFKKYEGREVIGMTVRRDR